VDGPRGTPVSYPLDLDEMSTPRLLNELAHRRKLRNAGKCDYCGRDPGTPSCKFPERHVVKPAKEPLLLRLMKFLRNNNRKPGVLSDNELRQCIVDFREYNRKPKGTVDA
jgi:hypothetical protein